MTQTEKPKYQTPKDFRTYAEIGRRETRVLQDIPLIVAGAMAQFVRDEYNGDHSKLSDSKNSFRAGEVGKKKVRELAVAEAKRLGFKYEKGNVPDNVADVLSVKLLGFTGDDVVMTAMDSGAEFTYSGLVDYLQKRTPYGAQLQSLAIMPLRVINSGNKNDFIKYFGLDGKVDPERMTVQDVREVGAQIVERGTPDLGRLVNEIYWKGKDKGFAGHLPAYKPENN